MRAKASKDKDRQRALGDIIRQLKQEMEQMGGWLAGCWGFMKQMGGWQRGREERDETCLTCLKNGDVYVCGRALRS